MPKGGRTNRRHSRQSRQSRSQSRSRSHTPELMRPWLQRLERGQMYRFQTRDNRVPVIGTYQGREGSRFIFLVNGIRTVFPINVINPVQSRGTRPGVDDAFVRITTGAGWGRTSVKKTRKMHHR